jgi:Sugar (and other) transporter
MASLPSPLSRLLGGVLFGHIGDRVGRRTALMISVLAMAVPSFAIGLLPTYASIGLLAPVLLILLRLIQGVSVGGELTVSMVYLGERSADRHRGISASLSPFRHRAVDGERADAGDARGTLSRRRALYRFRHQLQRGDDVAGWHGTDGRGVFDCSQRRSDGAGLVCGRNVDLSRPLAYWRHANVRAPVCREKLPRRACSRSPDSLRKGGGLVDATGGWLVGAKGNCPF